jgi:hypothetical protein
MRKNLLTLCVLCVFALNLKAQTTYDVFTYLEPFSYKKEIRKGSIAYTKTDTKTGTYCIISLFPQTQSKGDIVTDFNSDWAALVATPLNVKDVPKAENSEAISGWLTYSGAANFELNGGTSMALLTTAKKDNAIVSLLVITNAQSFLKDADAFFDNLQLGNPKVVVTNKSANQNSITIKASTSSSTTNFSGNGIEGVWISYNNSHILAYKAGFKYRIFFNDGKVLLTTPDAGLYNFKNTPDLNDYWGVYTYNNKNGVLKSGNNLRFTDNIKFVSNDVINIGEEEYRKCKSVNGSKLNGSFSYYGNGDPLQISLPYGQNPKMIFYSNGKFTDEGMYYQILKDHSKDDAYNAAGVGTYELKDYSIILTYTDGRIKQLSFTIPQSDTPANAYLILFGRVSLFKMKKN